MIASSVGRCICFAPRKEAGPGEGARVPNQPEQHLSLSDRSAKLGKLIHKPGCQRSAFARTAVPWACKMHGQVVDFAATGGCQVGMSIEPSVIFPIRLPIRHLDMALADARFIAGCSGNFSNVPMSADVRAGSIASILPCPHYVRFTPDSDRTADIAGGRIRANRRRRQVPYRHCGPAPEKAGPLLIGCANKLMRRSS